MAITINTNVLSLRGQQHLHMSNNALKTSLERLSTGFKINKAADNASNLAISKKMSCQISGTTVAQENAQQAISMLDTADSALAEMTEITNRIRDLSLQSMNGTYSDKERALMQQEVNKLTQELYRQKNSTKYNKIDLFAEDVPSAQTGATAAVAATQAVNAAEKPYKAELEYLESTGTQYIDTGILPTNHTTKIDFQYTSNKNEQAIFGTIAGTYYHATYFKNSFYYYTGVGGADVSDEIFGRHEIIYNDENSKFIYDGEEYSTLTQSFEPTDSLLLFGRNSNSGFLTNTAASAKIYSCQIIDKASGELVRDYIPVIDNNDVACMYDKVTGQFFYNQGTGTFVQGPVAPEPTPPEPEPEPEPTPEPTPEPSPEPEQSGSIDFQIGANSGKNNMLNIDLGFSLNDFNADVSTVESATDTLNVVDELKKTLVKKRSEIGTYRNRVDSVLQSQSTTLENLSSSHSTIMDTDFALESSNLVKSQILQQTTASLLAQCNFMPNLALQLLS